MLCWLTFASAATIRVGGKMPSRRRRLDSVGPFGNPDGSRADIDDVLSEVVDFGGDRGEAGGGQDGLPAASSGFPVPSGLRLRRRAAAGPAEDRSRGEGVPVVLGPGPGREVDADLGDRK